MAGGLLDQLSVSRETIERLKIYESVLKKWNSKINLISRHSVPDIWNRHIIDSVQVFRCVPTPDHWVDLGSGGGLPGLIVGIMASVENPDTRVTLIESDQRKAAFLRTAARECGANIEVISKRIESCSPQQSGVLSARALADLSKLLEFSEQHLDPNGIAVFPKGANWKKEVDNAQQRWRFDFEAITSLTEPDAVLLRIEGVARV
jgi:16S rRNA (guanine527-N7)-methyltransferase